MGIRLFYLLVNSLVLLSYTNFFVGFLYLLYFGTWILTLENFGEAVLFTADLNQEIL